VVIVATTIVIITEAVRPDDRAGVSLRNRKARFGGPFFVAAFQARTVAAASLNIGCRYG